MSGYKCVCCETNTSACLTFTQSAADGVPQTSICINCVVKGSRWLVDQAAEQQRKESEQEWYGCRRLGCQETQQSELIYIVGDRRYCKTCFAQYQSQHSRQSLQRWEWIRHFHNWADNVPRVSAMMQDTLTFDRFEMYARTCVIGHAQ